MCIRRSRSRRCSIRRAVSCVWSGCVARRVMWRSAFLLGARPAGASGVRGRADGVWAARAAVGRGLDVRVVAPGSIPRAPGDRVKTDRRDAKRLVRLFAAGELSFAFVPSEEDERFRDLVRCIEDARKDLMRSRHRLSKFLLRRGLRYAGRAWTQPYGRWLRNLTFEDALSRATFVDYCASVEGLAQRRQALTGVLEEAVPASSHAQAVARLRCFRGIDTLSAAGLCAEVGSFERFAKPSLLLGVPRDRAERVHLRQQARAGLDHEGRPAARAQATRRGRAPLPSPSRCRGGHRRSPGRPGPQGRADRLARTATPPRTLDTPR